MLYDRSGEKFRCRDFVSNGLKVFLPPNELSESFSVPGSVDGAAWGD